MVSIDVFHQVAASEHPGGKDTSYSHPSWRMELYVRRHVRLYQLQLRLPATCPMPFEVPWVMPIYGMKLYGICPGSQENQI